LARLDPLKEFSEDHKRVRELLLKLMEEIEAGRIADARKTLSELDKLVGPHFRFEEESLYPLLQRFFGKAYYESLLRAHDRVIDTARKLAQALSKEQLAPEERRQLVEAIRTNILPHVVECEGLVLFAEKLSKAELESLAEAIERARREGVPLLEWAEKLRKKHQGGC
jgi:hemerythrin